jgi:hypothetical protein
MTSITLSVPEEIRQKMKKHAEVNWSGFIRRCIEEKARALTLKEELLEQSAHEQEIVEWSVQLQKKTRVNNSKGQSNTKNK